MSQTHPHILRRIQENKEKKLEALDLSYETTRIRLSQTPPEVFALKHLKALNLGRQALTILPEAVLRLENLTSLDLCLFPLPIHPVSRGRQIL